MTKSLPVHDLDAALDAYVSSTAHALIATVARELAHTAEPTSGYDPVRALWILERYIESVCGFAIGIVAASLARGARVWLGEGEDRVVVAALDELAERGLPDATGVIASTGWFERDSSLVDVLAPWLHSRTCALATAVRALATAVRDAIPERRSRALAVMFARLGSDTLVSERFSHELRVGWQHVLAALAGRRGDAESPLWHEWTRRLCGDELPAPEPAPGEYIVVIR
jgi:hypothetical protein